MNRSLVRNLGIFVIAAGITTGWRAFATPPCEPEAFSELTVQSVTIDGVPSTDAEIASFRGRADYEGGGVYWVRGYDPDTKTGRTVSVVAQ